MFGRTHYFINFWWENLSKIEVVVIHLQVLEPVKSQKWRVGSPTINTCIHRLSSPLGSYHCQPTSLCDTIRGGGHCHFRCW